MHPQINDHVVLSAPHSSGVFRVLDYRREADKYIILNVDDPEEIGYYLHIPPQSIGHILSRPPAFKFKDRVICASPALTYLYKGCISNVRYAIQLGSYVYTVQSDDDGRTYLNSVEEHIGFDCNRGNQT